MSNLTFEEVDSWGPKELYAFLAAPMKDLSASAMEKIIELVKVSVSSDPRIHSPAIE